MSQTRDRQLRDRGSILTRVVIAFCILTVFGATSSSSSASSSQLTSEDKQLLARGELVMKEKNERRGAYKLFGGQSWQIIDLPIDVVWNALTDLPGYKSFIPLATESDIKHRAGKEADLAIRQQWGPVDVHYVLQTTTQSDRGAVVFRVDHSQDHDIRAGWGFIRVRPYEGDRTLVSFGALVDIGDGVFVSIIRPAVRRDLLKIPYFLKKHLEGEASGVQTAEAKR